MFRRLFLFSVTPSGSKLLMHAPTPVRVLSAVVAVPVVRSSSSIHDQAIGIGVHQDVEEFADRHIVRGRFLWHEFNLVATSQVTLASNRFKNRSNLSMSLRGEPVAEAEQAWSQFGQPADRAAILGHVGAEEGGAAWRSPGHAIAWFMPLIKSPTTATRSCSRKRMTCPGVCPGAWTTRNPATSSPSCKTWATG